MTHTAENCTLCAPHWRASNQRVNMKTNYDNMITIYENMITNYDNMITNYVLLMSYIQYLHAIIEYVVLIAYQKIRLLFRIENFAMN